MRDELARPVEISEMFLKDWEQREGETRKRQLKVMYSTVDPNSYSRIYKIFPWPIQPSRGKTIP